VAVALTAGGSYGSGVPTSLAGFSDYNFWTYTVGHTIGSWAATAYNQKLTADTVTVTGTGIPIATGTTSNTDLAGFLTLSGGSQTYSFTTTHATTPVCTATDITAVAAVQAVATTTTLTVNGTGTDVIAYICIGRT
jgi:hypothetical protein